MEKIYSLGKVYKITSGNSDKVYIGSTTQKLKKRLIGHMADFKRYMQGEVINISSFEVLKEGDVKIELIEEFEDITRKELAKHEGKYIQEMDCVNKMVAGRTKKEYYEDNRESIAEYQKKYLEDNRESIVEYRKKYYEDNNAEIIAKTKKYKELNHAEIVVKNKEYRERNADIIKAKKKEYREKNAEMIKAKKKEYREQNADVIKAKKKAYYEEKKKQKELNKE